MSAAARRLETRERGEFICSEVVRRIIVSGEAGKQSVMKFIVHLRRGGLQLGSVATTADECGGDGQATKASQMYPAGPGMDL